MKRHILWGKLGAADLSPTRVGDKYTRVSEIDLISGGLFSEPSNLAHGIGATLQQLKHCDLKPSEAGVDLALLATLITIADTRISRDEDSQDSWSREVEISLPVADPTAWTDAVPLLENMLKFLTGDYWVFNFRPRPINITSLVEAPEKLQLDDYSIVSLFSGGLDSYIGAIDLLKEGTEKPLFISSYGDHSTKDQGNLIELLGQHFGDLSKRHVRANIHSNTEVFEGAASEDTYRGRSFLFFALAGLAASSLRDGTRINVPENGLISLNVPLDPMRLGAYSTRTTHPYYLARWNELLERVGISSSLSNPYRFNTKGEMAENCKDADLLKKTYARTFSCSSVFKNRTHSDPTRRIVANCGYCVPCLIRRASITHAFNSDETVYNGVEDLNANQLDTLKSEGRDVRSFQHMISRLSKNPDLYQTLIHKSGPLSDYAQVDIKEYAEVFKRGIEEVGALLNHVAAKPL